MMLNKFQLLIPGLVVLLGACVTTREQYNAERGIYAEGSQAIPTVVKPSAKVQSEELSSSDSVVKVVESDADGDSSGKPSTAPIAPAVTAPTPNQQNSKPDYTSFSEDELKAEVARLSGKVEELEHEKKEGSNAKNDELKKAELRIAELEKRLQELNPEPLKAPEGKTDLEAGKDAFSANRFDDAIHFFGLVLTKKESGKEAEEATFLRAESYFKKGQFTKAIVDYSQFPEKFQKSSNHPKALLKIGECFENLGRKDDAKAFYSDLVEKFPKTAEGKLAKKRLKK